MFEFHISRQARDHYKFDESLFQFNGNMIFANFHAVRQFVQKINQKRDLINFPEQAVKAGQVNALGLIDEILHHVVSLYRKQKNPKVMVEALEWMETVIGKAEIDRALEQFTTDFPPLDVYKKTLSVKEYLADVSEDIPNRAIALEEMMMLWVTNKNLAAQPYQEFFEDSTLSTSSAYARMLGALQQFFDTQPLFGPEQQNLLDMLRAPALAVPYSLTGQLEFIRTHWAELLGRYLYRLLSSLDLVKEEEKAGFMGPGPVPIPVYDASMAGLSEPERFSMDREWMPRLVVIAKNAYVLLDQLSKKYKLPINHLDQIPDSELDTLAKWGFSGLWLIGLWERSKASERVKKLCGNPDAVASAYSLDSYQIAADLGGESAYQNLRDRAWQRGIRLASDMVPNHMGIDSGWVM
ncbi:MAG: alpha-amylase, partial [Anaerolineaceae bacterium]|nr:alpha-amylase [Anaerolineaceae bacterium]